MYSTGPLFLTKNINKFLYLGKHLQIIDSESTHTFSSPTIFNNNDNNNNNCYVLSKNEF